MRTCCRTAANGAKAALPNRGLRIEALFRGEQHAAVEATWGVYQRMITAYRETDRTRGRRLMCHLIESLSHGVPAALSELRKLGRTLKRRAADVLAYFVRPGTSNGPTEAINGRLEHLRGSALGFRNLTNYIARSLLEAGGFRPRLHHSMGHYVMVIAQASSGRPATASVGVGHDTLPNRSRA